MTLQAAEDDVAKGGRSVMQIVASRTSKTLEERR